MLSEPSEYFRDKVIDICAEMYNIKKSAICRAKIKYEFYEQPDCEIRITVNIGVSSEKGFIDYLISITGHCVGL